MSLWGVSKGVIMTKVSTKTQKLVEMGILTAILLIFAFTPIGYLKVGAIEITFMTIPVAVGAIVLGPAAGAVLGGIFGITSFIQCFMGSVFGAFLVGLNPWLTFIVCFIPRVLCGWLTGFIFRGLKKIDKTKILSFVGASLSTALLNTLFFMGCIVLFFWNNAEFTGTMASWGMPTDGVWIFLVTFVGMNGLVEAVVSFIIGAAIAKALVKIIPANHANVNKKA